MTHEVKVTTENARRSTALNVLEGIFDGVDGARHQWCSRDCGLLATFRYADMLTCIIALVIFLTSGFLF